VPSIHGAVQIGCDIGPGGLRAQPVVAVASVAGHCFCYVLALPVTGYHMVLIPSQSY